MSSGAAATSAFAFFEDVGRDALPPAGGILSRTLYDDEQLRVVVFGFAAGEELSEHTAGWPAVLHVVSGAAALTLGAESRRAGPGSFARMAAGLPHSIRAETPLVMLLLLLKSA